MPREVPPGWYPDPYGTAGLLRWWDGVQWSTFTQEAPEPEPEEPQPARSESAEPEPTEPEPLELRLTDPGRAGPHAPEPEPAGPGQAEAPGPRIYGVPPRDVPADDPLLSPYDEPRRRTRWPWLAASGLLAAAVAVAAVLLRTDAVGLIGGDRAARPVATASATPQPPQPAAAGRIDDPAAGLSYARLGGRWKVMDRARLRTMRWTAGQYQIAQDDYDGKGHDALASCLSSPLPGNFPYSGSGDLADTSASLARTIEKTFYPAHSRRHDRTSEATRVDGHPAWLRTYVLSYPDAQAKGYDFRSETVTIVLVDRGQRAPGVLWVSIPDNRDELLPDVETVISSLRVQ